MECSPFMRCLQTAARIQEQLGEEFNTQVEVNYAACEHLQTIDFEYFNPLPTLESVAAEDGVQSQELREFYDLGETKFVDNELNKPLVIDKWPEDLQASHSRAMWLQDNFCNVLKENEGQKICYLVISHGMLVEQMSNIWKKDDEIADSFSIPTKDATQAKKDEVLESIKDMDWSGLPKIGYCCINSFTSKPDLTEFEL